MAFTMTDHFTAQTLKAEIERGLADLAEGRVQDFDASRIVKCGRKRLVARVSSKLCEPSSRNHN